MKCPLTQLPCKYVSATKKPKSKDNKPTERSVYRFSDDIVLVHDPEWYENWLAKCRRKQTEPEKWFN